MSNMQITEDPKGHFTARVYISETFTVEANCEEDLYLRFHRELLARGLTAIKVGLREPPAEPIETLPLYTDEVLALFIKKGPDREPSWWEQIIDINKGTVLGWRGTEKMPILTTNYALVERYLTRRYKCQIAHVGIYWVISHGKGKKQITTRSGSKGLALKMMVDKLIARKKVTPRDRS